MTDVLIVGGGVIGLSIARQLHKKGVRDITIVERRTLGREASFAAAGMLAPQAEADQADDFFRLCSQSRDMYPEYAEELLDETGIDIELDTSGTLYLAFDETDVEELRRRFHWQSKAGLSVEQLNSPETHKLEPFVSPDAKEALFFKRDWQIENRKLLLALAAYAKSNEIELCEESEITRIEPENEGFEVTCRKTDRIRARVVILATGAWTSFVEIAGFTAFPTLIKPIRGQMLGFRTAKRLFRRVIYSPRGYIVPRKGGKILAGATVEDVGFDDRTTAEGIEALKESTYEISPSISNLPIDEKWSGLRPFASDGLPVIGEIKSVRNLFIATAHYRNGILLAPMTAKLLTDKIINAKKSDVLDKYSPERFKVVGAF